MINHVISCWFPQLSLLGRVNLAAQAILSAPTNFQHFWLWGPVTMTHCVRYGFLTTQQKGGFGGWTLSRNMQLRIAAKPSLMCCHLTETNELVGVATAIPPFVKLLWFLFCIKLRTGEARWSTVAVLRWLNGSAVQSHQHEAWTAVIHRNQYSWDWLHSAWVPRSQPIFQWFSLWGR